MKFLFAMLFFIDTLTNVLAQTTETRDLRDFSKIHASLAADITLVQADTFSFTAEGTSKRLYLLETNIKNGVLTIKMPNKTHVWDDVDKLKIRISAPNFEQLDFSGFGEIRAKTLLSGKKLIIDISGAGNIELQNIAFEDLQVDFSGAGNLSLHGTADRATFDLSGAGNIDADELKVQSAHCEVSGVGSLSCFVIEDLNAEVSGIGSVKYRGEPKSLNKHVSGIGRVRRL